MNKYRVIITEPNGEELFNKVYEVPEHSPVINYLTDDPGFLNDLKRSDIYINEPNLKWSIYFESPLEFEQDKLIKEIRTETDFAKRVDLMHQAEDMLMDTGAVMSLYYYNDVYMCKSNIKGIYATVFGMKYFMYATKD